MRGLEMLITLNSYSLPCDNLPIGDYTLRYWYNYPFIDSTGQPVYSGTATSGTQIRVDAEVTGGFLAVDNSPIYTTVDSQGPFPQSINLTCQLFQRNSAKNIYPFSQVNCPPSWIIYNPDPLVSWDFDTLTFLQQASKPAYQQEWMVTNQEMIAYVNSLIGSAGTVQRATMVNGSVTVASTLITPTTNILVSSQDVAVTGTLSAPLTSRVNGVSFNIVSTNIGDNGEVAYLISN
jgi:hypothetical protein